MNKFKQVKNLFLLGGMALIAVGAQTAQAKDSPWRLENALGLPEWLHFSVQHRTRYEVLDNQFRARVNGRPGRGGDQAILFRTLVQASFDLDNVTIGAEMIDSRIELADAGTASAGTGLTTNIVDPLDLLQAYVEVRNNDLFLSGSQSLLRAGRLTIDMGSRRLLARNGFRNTINSFTGGHWSWQFEDHKFQAFYTLPVRRLVDGKLTNNDDRFDRGYGEVQFWGVNYSQSSFTKEDKAELFLYTLNEDDTPDWATRNRELYTFGARIWRQPKVGQFDYQLETIYQLGRSRISAASLNTLDHEAHYQHADFGYSFDAMWSPRLNLLYDYGSGDDDPNDNKNNRFDSLYGGRRFDLGPTSIFGPFNRTNINSPGIRLTLNPHSAVSTMVTLRGFWRATTKDAWSGAGHRGKSAYTGTQLEALVRWQMIPGNVTLEGGVAHLFAGDLMDEVRKDDSTYAYSQAVFKF